MMLEQMDSDTSFKMNINSTPCTKSNSKCYGKSKSIKFPEENNITRKLQDTKQAWCCWTWHQKLYSQRTKCKVELYDSEEAFALWRKMKRRAADAKRIFANQPSGPRLVSEYIKNPPKSLIGKKKPNLKMLNCATTHILKGLKSKTRRKTWEYQVLVRRSNWNASLFVKLEKLRSLRTRVWDFLRKLRAHFHTTHQSHCWASTTEKWQSVP